MPKLGSGDPAEWVEGLFTDRIYWNKMWGWWVMLWLTPGIAEHCFALVWSVLRVRADEMKAIFFVKSAVKSIFWHVVESSVPFN